MLFFFTFSGLCEYKFTIFSKTQNRSLFARFDEQQKVQETLKNTRILALQDIKKVTPKKPSIYQRF